MDDVVLNRTLCSQGFDGRDLQRMRRDGSLVVDDVEPPPGERRHGTRSRRSIDWESRLVLPRTLFTVLRGSGVVNGGFGGV
jgi:hypothetical protein